MKTIEDAVRDNNGEWPGDHPLSEVLVWAGSSWNAWPKEWAGKEFYGWHEVCTRTEFDECAARLRNEPDWEDAPPWAVAKAQDDDGEWYWYEVEPNDNRTTWSIATFGRTLLASTGEVIGDWRETLRLRPAENKMGTKNEGMTHQEAERNRHANEVPSAPDNDWHLRGEFPPVGAVCEVFPWFHICESVAPHRDGMVMHDRRNDEYFLATKNTRFRPIQTERERLIEKACKVAVDSYCIEDTVKSLADAGMLKMPEEE